MTSITATGGSIFRSSMPRPGAVLALARRDLLIYASYRLMMTLDLWIGALDVVVYYFISETFEGASTASFGGAPSYFAFALVGIAVARLWPASPDACVARHTRIGQSGYLISNVLSGSCSRWAM